jgi:hypothetical protein
MLRAYRASIITTWTAVVYDLIDTIRELAISGNKQAKELIQKLEKNLAEFDPEKRESKKKLLLFENNILTQNPKNYS